MTERRAIDYAWTHPNPAAIKAGGYEAVMRYISHSPSKDITPAEVHALHAAGLAIGLVWETTANRATQGAAAGTQDARDAEAKADALGYPKDAVIFYAVDFDGTPDQVRSYFAAVKATAKRPVGIYGGIKVINARLAPYRWQTAAWSGGKLSGYAHLYQRIHATGRISGAPTGWDENVICKDFPLWKPGTVKPTPAPKPPVVSQRDVVPPVKARHNPNFDAIDKAAASAAKSNKGAKRNAALAVRKLVKRFLSSGKA